MSVSLALLKLTRQFRMKVIEESETIFLWMLLLFVFYNTFANEILEISL